MSQHTAFEPDQEDSIAPEYLGRVGDEPLPGYHLLEVLGRGGFGEVWKCLAPGGLLKAIKMVPGNRDDLGTDDDLAETEWEALQCIKEVRHPFILSTERVELVEGQLVIVMELADRNLDEVRTEYRDQGELGIPREELLGYLLEAAEALDLMSFQHGLQHLDIKPHNLFVISQHAKVADFGLVNALCERSPGTGHRAPRTGLTPLYAAPELLQGQISPQCDQYSLAIVYQELLTGSLPFRGKNPRQLMFEHLQSEPDLSSLPEADQPILRRALAKKPEDRFPSCLDMVRSLWQREIVIDESGSSGSRSAGWVRRASPPAPGAGPSETPPAMVDPSPYRFLGCLYRSPMGEMWSVETHAGEKLCTHHLQAVPLFDPAARERAFGRLRALTDPALIPFEVLENGPGSIVLRSEPAGLTLRDLSRESRPVGKPGLDRDELLQLLLPFGQTLDELAAQHGLFHLGLHPGILCPQDYHLRVREFGWLQLLWLGGPEPLERFNHRYAAPELRDNRPGPLSDQYSLALLYAELLTGRHPRKQATAEVDLTALPSHDRDIVARALSQEPDRRYPSNDDFFGALLKAGERPLPPQSVGTRPAIQPSRAGDPVPAHLPPARFPASRYLIQQLVNDVLGTGEVMETEGCRYLLRPGTVLEHHCGIIVPTGGLELLAETLRKSLRADHLDRQAESWTLLVRPKRSLWRKQPGLQLRLDFLGGTPGQFSTVLLKIRPVDVPPGSEEGFLAQHGPTLLGAVRGLLHPLPEHRAEERLTWEQTVLIEPIFPNVEVQTRPLVAQARDLSLSGLGLLMPEEPVTTRYRVTLPVFAAAGQGQPGELTGEMTAAVRLTRTRRLPTGWFDVGLAFDLDNGTR